MATQIPKAIRKIQSNEIVEVKTKRPAPKAAPKDIPTTSKKVCQIQSFLINQNKSLLDIDFFSYRR